MNRLFNVISKLTKMERTCDIRFNRLENDQTSNNNNNEDAKSDEDNLMIPIQTCMRNNNSLSESFQNSNKTEMIIESSDEISNTKKTVLFKPTISAVMEINEMNRPLLQEIHRQTQIMSQVTKALRLLKPESMDEVEAHKILLVAELRRHASIIHLPIIDIINQKPRDILFTLNLKNISLSQTLHLLDYEELRKEKETSFTAYYVCTATSGTKVLSSNISEDAETICFDKEMHFDKLLTNFSIKLAFYKFRLKNVEKESKWLKIKSIFKNDKANNDIALDFIAKNKFYLVGKSFVHRRNASAKLGYFKLVDIPMHTLLENFIAVEYDFYSDHE